MRLRRTALGSSIPNDLAGDPPTHCPAFLFIINTLVKVQRGQFAVCDIGSEHATSTSTNTTCNAFDMDGTPFKE